MKTIGLNHVQLNVFSENLINSLSIDHLKKVVPQLTEYIGKKICLASGDKSKTFKIDLMSYKDKENQIVLRTFIKFTNYHTYTDVELHQDVCVPNKEFKNGGGYSVRYYDKNISLGKIHNGILDQVYTIDELIEKYNLKEVYVYEEIQVLIKKQEELEEEARKLERKVNRFKAFN